MRGCNETVSGGAGMTNAISVKDRLIQRRASLKEPLRHFYIAVENFSFAAVIFCASAQSV
jgi:hypothetical protein